MITVHYKPLEALRPVHISILAVAESTSSLDSIGEILGVPLMLLEHAADDLVIWKMISITNRQVELHERAFRCVAVWAATDRRGFWNITNDDKWVLGKGVFFFRDPLMSLNDATLDPETGKVLTEAQALKCLKDYKISIERLEVDIQTNAIRTEIIKTISTNGDMSNAIESSLGRAKSRLQLNRLYRQADAAFDDFFVAETNQRGKSHEFKRLLQHKKSKVEQSIMRLHRETDGFTKLLIASWLKQRDGLLGEIAATDPNAILIRSEQEDVSWTKEVPREQQIKHQPKINIPTQSEANKPTQSEKNPSIIDDVFEFFGSFFR
jgi:hypothetical protein